MHEAQDMIWIFLLILSAAIAFFKLGSYKAWVVILLLALKVTTVALLVAMVAIVIPRVYPRIKNKLWPDSDQPIS
jgi:hypothetical protein